MYLLTTAQELFQNEGIRRIVRFIMTPFVDIYQWLVDNAPGKN